MKPLIFYTMLSTFHWPASCEQEVIRAMRDTLSAGGRYDPFHSRISGVSTNLLDMTDAIAPFAGTVLVGLFLSSLAGIVITVLVDRWLTQRQQRSWT